MSLKIIAAVGAGNHVIGAKDSLPWRDIPSDIRHFKEIIMGHPVVMGRKRWNLLTEADRPFAGSENIVLTRNASSVKLDKGVVMIFNNIESIIEVAKVENIFVIGGAKTYELFIPHADVLLLTLVHGEFKGDAYFPTISPADWFESKARIPTKEATDPYCITFCTFSRRKISSLKL